MQTVEMRGLYESLSRGKKCSFDPETSAAINTIEAHGPVFCETWRSLQSCSRWLEPLSGMQMTRFRADKLQDRLYPTAVTILYNNAVAETLSVRDASRFESF